MKKRPAWLLNLVLILFSISFSLLMVEGMARLYLVGFAPDLVFNKYASIQQLNKRYGDARFEPDRYLGFSPAKGYQSGLDLHNELGYRGEAVVIPKPAGVYRIVTLGGSTTYSGGVEDYHLSYPYLLGGALQGMGYSEVEVINAGAFSYSSTDTLINLQFRVLDLGPDMIVVYHGVNDIPPRLVWPARFYMADATHYEERKIETSPPWWERLTLARMALVRFDLAEPHISLRRSFIEARGAYYGDLFANQLFDETYPSGFLAKHPAEEMLDENPPIYFERNLRFLTAIADTHEMEMLLVTFAYAPGADAELNYVSPEYIRAYGEHNVVMSVVAGDTNALLYDLAADMPQDVVYFTDGIHFSAAGNQVRADLIAAFLTESGVLP